MIYVNMSGGLGNQLFEYAYAREIQRLTGQNIELNIYELVNYEQNRKFALDRYALPDTVHIGKRELPWYVHRRSLRGALIRKISPKLMKWYGIRHNGHIWYESSYTDFPEPVVSRDIYLGGYWQSPRYSMDVHSEMISDILIREELSEEISQLHSKISECNAVCMHVRRDDYVGSNYEVCSENYYQQAMQNLESQFSDLTYYVFSDDPEWAEKHIHGHKQMVYVKGHQDYEDLYLMSGCHHFIMSNSSYSWWAQELSVYKDKQVYAPSIWHRKWNNKDIYENNWKKIQVD